MMTTPASAPQSACDDPPDELMEGVARVVALEGGVAWLEPETTSSCGGCASLAACGTKGRFSRALAARRFPLDGVTGLRLGDRVVVGLPESAVLRASATAYGLPLATLVAGGMLAQGLGVGDGTGALMLLGGLGAGLLVARRLADGLVARGDFSPRFLRRIGRSEDGAGSCEPQRVVETR